MQGDVIGVVDGNGNKLAEYSYDSWGNVTSQSGTLAEINPIRYKGYYYDSDIGMYYLQSRYYDPSLRRFINADDPNLVEDLAKSSVIGSNLFGYCDNNGVVGYDPTGEWFYSLGSYYYYYRSRYSGRTWRNFLSHYNRYKSGYDNNIKLFGSYKDYIWGQKYKWDKIHVNIRDMVYNKAKIGNVGCELVAVYNVMKRLGKWKNFADIIAEFVINGLSWYYGYLGTESKYLGKYFDAHSVNYKHYTNMKQFEKAAKNGKIAIVSFWNSSWLHDGIHTVAIFYVGKMWCVYNYSSYDEKLTKFGSFSKILKGKHFIRGYVF